MTIKLVRVDASNCTKIQLGHGEHIIGRGKLLDCNDKRISREHGELLIDDSTVTIKALHLNPCFFKLKDSKGTEILQLGSSKILNNGDRFGLLPDDFWYEIIYCPEGEDFGRSDSEKNTEEYSLADAVPSDSHTLNSNKIKVDGLHASNINNDDTYNNSSRPESPSLLSMHNDDTIQVNQNKPVSNNNKPVQPKDTEPNSSNSLQNHSDEEKTENGDESSEKSPSIKRSHSPDSYDVKKFKTVNVVVKVEPDDVRPGPSDTAAGGNVNDDAASRDKPNRQRERCIYGVNCYRRNPQHLAQFSHPRDADWGAGERGECPYGAACRKADARHWRCHDHPPGTLPPPRAGVQVVERRGNVFIINAQTVNFYDDHFEVEDTDGDSVDYDYEF
ncbi:aprataxin and PNK-like factor isoform X3 [Nymphalis io]|uniref:aprataxin and PNK-like factor isoform X3 n=1 Tax=Inachis io TaxID=171585 RepID=UPI00216A55DB|nr:aprataxin and PNK-like factor isoform X3 [Nymphalis io]